MLQYFGFYNTPDHGPEDEVDEASDAPVARTPVGRSRTAAPREAAGRTWDSGRTYWAG